MADQRPVPENDAWDDEVEPGTSSTMRFRGPVGVARLSGPVTVTAADPDQFHAKLTRVLLDRIMLEAFTATPHTLKRDTAEMQRYPAAELSFLLLVEGHVHVELSEASFELRSGDCFVLDSRDTMHWSGLTDIKLIRGAVGLQHIPDPLHRQSATVPGPMRRTTLVESYIAFISSLFATTAAGRRARGEHLVQAVAELQSAVLAEAQKLQWSLDTGADLRRRMEQYIEANYRNPDLNPELVAHAFAISVRHAHGTFNHDGITIARFIRDRRVTAAADELRTAEGPVRLGDIAHQLGFNSTDILTRAFQRRFSVTPTEYRDRSDQLG